jgi:signal transduction histidine kinase
MEESECIVFGNFDLLYIAIKNIIENGCKYSADHCSRVKLESSAERILVNVSNKGDVIAEQEIEQIFQPFYRGDNATEVRGFGLGLPLARRIISLHKGEIKVNSGLTGTRFTIVLPASTKA